MAKKVKENNEVSAVRRSKSRRSADRIFQSADRFFHLYPIFSWC